MEQKMSGCFLVGVTGPGWTLSGKALLGSVSDDPYDVRTFMKSVHPEGALAHLGTELVSTSEHTLTERGYFARPGETTRGINEAGLAFTCAMVIEDPDQAPHETSTPYADITEEMMKRCKTVEEAIDLFQSKGRVTPAYSVLMADAEGNLAHLEVGNHGISIYERHDPQNPGAVFAVNCYLSKSLVHYNAPHTLITDKENNNAARRSRGVDLARQLEGKLDVKSLAELLSDHQNRERDPMSNPILAAWGYSICNHGTRKSDVYPKEDLPWGTVSAEILEPSTREFWYAYGWPCGGPKEHGDQLFQENSWGRFVAFEMKPGKGVLPLSTPSGEITAEGKSRSSTKAL